MATSIDIWPGSGSAISGSTPFGIYDGDAVFQDDGPKVALWATRRLGYPIMSVELSDVQIYACFEESVSEYSSQINNASMINWLLNYYGEPTSSEFTHKFPTNTFGFSKRYANAVAVEAGVGGTHDWKSGSISIQKGVQYYDLQALWGAASESNARLEVREVWHYPPAAMGRFFSPHYSGIQEFINSDWGNFGSLAYESPMYHVLPLYHDVLRAQAIELNDLFRKSNYSYEVINNKLRITPMPVNDTRMFFRYTVNTTPLSDDDSSTGTESLTGVADQANVPYTEVTYNKINSMGKQWIRRYTLALSKETLGEIRSKFASLPIPNSDITLNGGELKSEAITEKETLITEIKELLERTSNEKLMESEASTQIHLGGQLNKIPLLIYTK